jgi:hypothetical protein
MNATKWKRALSWFIPLLVWVVWIAYSTYDIDVQRRAIDAEAGEPGQNLAACLDFALDDFTTPSPTKRAACHARFPDDEARVARQRVAHRKRITFDAESAAVALAALAAYFVFVPRRFRAGFRAWIFVAVALVLLAGAALFLVVASMPRGD